MALAKNKKVRLRARRKTRVRKQISGTAERPRLSVFRSSRYIYAQLIDDIAGCTLASASSREGGVSTDGGNIAAAAKVGEQLGARAKEKSISVAVFDRNGYQYHGRVAALADGARKAGLTI